MKAAPFESDSEADGRTEMLIDLIEKGLVSPISNSSAFAQQYRYYDGKWHLQEFWYGKPPHVAMVWVGQDDEPNPK